MSKRFHNTVSTFPKGVDAKALRDLAMLWGHPHDMRTNVCRGVCVDSVLSITINGRGSAAKDTRLSEPGLVFGQVSTFGEDKGHGVLAWAILTLP
jgi:hypothetical protein